MHESAIVLYNKEMSNITRSQSTAIKLIIVCSVLLLGVSGWTYYSQVYTQPTKVFERMLSTSFSTPGVTTTSTEGDSSQQLVEITQLVTSPKPLIHVGSSLISDGGETVVNTETIDTPKDYFIKYSGIKTSQKTADGKDFNFSKVINIWGKTDAIDPASEGAQLFNRTILHIVPTANLNPIQRKELINKILKDKVYTVDYSKVKRQTIAGRPVYSYDVSLQPAPYLTMLKTFAKDIGFKFAQLEQANPEKFKDQPPQTFTFDVDVWSGELTKIVFTKESSRSEVYGAYGARTRIEPPAQSISVEELRSRLEQIH